MLQQSIPSPATAPRLEVIGPHFEKIFLPDRWNPLHILRAPDTGPPHDHPYTMHRVKIVRGGYRETVWVLTPGGGYTVHFNVERRPGTMHEIGAETIHLITELLDGFSISEPEPEEARREWFFYWPNVDGSVLRSSHWDGPWEPYHPAGAVVQINPPDEIARLAPVAAAGARGATECKQAFVDEADWHHKSDQDFSIGPNNTGWQAWTAMLAGHCVRRPHWHDTRQMFIVHIPADGFIYLKPTLDLMITTLASSPLWKETAKVTSMRGENLAAVDWIVLPQIHAEPPVI